MILLCLYNFKQYFDICLRFFYNIYCSYKNYKEFLMLVRVRKTGNSLAITLPQEIAESLKIKEKDWVDVRLEDGIIIVTPVEIIHRKEIPSDKS